MTPRKSHHIQGTAAAAVASHREGAWRVDRRSDCRCLRRRRATCRFSHYARRAARDTLRGSRFALPTRFRFRWSSIDQVFGFGEVGHW